MRALFYKNQKFEEGQNWVIEGEDLHHLSNVVRVETKETILFLNGLGDKAFFLVEEISKKKIEGVIQKVEQVNKKNISYEIAVGLIKKNDFDLVVKQAVEMGVSKIYPLMTKFSQDYPLNEERLERVIKSAIEQSNNPFNLEISKATTLEEMNWNIYSEIYLAHNAESFEAKAPEMREQINKKILIVLGPEGGFAEGEVNFVLEQPETRLVAFQTEIMRTTTAVPYCLGFVSSSVDRL
ncbi:MAG: RsmE family RNA methyltransferase [Halobacteriovoraceae bacterium]|nr:RsmE family RNA methyltransferase [Halobacteriovoraceae bacterium]